MTSTLYYYLDRNRRPVGPIGADVLSLLAQNDVIDPTTLVIAKGETEWRPYATAFVASAASALPPAQKTATASDAGYEGEAEAEEGDMEPSAQAFEFEEETDEEGPAAFADGRERKTDAEERDGCLKAVAFFMLACMSALAFWLLLSGLAK